jgi:hypothetical protein
MSFNYVSPANLARLATNFKNYFARTSHTHSISDITDYQSTVSVTNIPISSDIASGTAITVPAHTVNSDKMIVFFNGMLCKRGSSEQYVDSSSTSIEFTFALSAGSELTIYIVN